MSFNPLAILQERQCAGVYDALDSGRASNAVQECNALLSKQPDLHLASALKAVGLCRLNRTDEANKVVDGLTLLNGMQLSSSLLSALGIALSHLQRDLDEADLLDKASKAQVNSVDLAAKACLAMARTSQWQRMQQTALRLHKLTTSITPSKGKSTKKDDLYFWWSMQAYSLTADDATLTGYQLALPLAQRMIAKHLESHPFGEQSDEAMFLYARILQKLGTADAKSHAMQQLTHDDVGKRLCKRSIALDALRGELQVALEQWDIILSESLQLLVDGGNNNWLVVETAVKAALNHTEEQQRRKALRNVEEAFNRLAKANARDRSARLAPIYLHRQVVEHKQQGALSDQKIVQRIAAYFDTFANKACTFEDLEPAIRIATESERKELLQHLQAYFAVPSQPFASLDALYKVMNACKLVRQLHLQDEIDVEFELRFAERCGQSYRQALPLGTNLPKTEMQPADDFALLSAQALIHASALQRDQGGDDPSSEWQTTLHLAIALLQTCLEHSPKGYRIRIVLIRLLLQFGAVNEARLHFDALGVKGVQFDTLGWIIASRFSTSTLMLAPSSTEEREWLDLMRRMRSVWHEGQTQVPLMVEKALEHGTFSRVEEMLVFGKRLRNSVARRLHSVEAVRLQTMNIETGVKDAKLQSELREFQESSQRTAKHPEETLDDQRDRQVLPNYLAPCLSVSIETLTSTSAKGDPGAEYFNAMLNVASAEDTQKENGGEDSQIQSRSPLVSVEERMLEALARSSKGEKSQVHGLLKETVTRFQNNFASSTTLPFTWLHGACVLLEAFYVAKKKHLDENAPDLWSEISNNLIDIRDALEEIVGAMQAVASMSNDDARVEVDESWSDIFASIARHSQKTSATNDNGVQAVQKAIKTVHQGTQTATQALLSRATSAIKSV